MDYPNTFKTEGLSKNSAPRFTHVWGNSMAPALANGQRILILPCRPEEVRPGDVAVFKNKALVCHRILGVFRIGKRYVFIQKGDSARSGSAFLDTQLCGLALTAEGQSLRRELRPTAETQAWGWLYLLCYTIGSPLARFELFRRAIRSCNSFLWKVRL